MRNFMNGISKGLAFIMAAAMVFTSVPSTVWAGELGTVEESSDILSTSGTISEAADVDSSETLDTVTEDSYIDSDTVSEKASGVTFKEGGDDLDPDTYAGDIEITFANTTDGGATDPEEVKLYKPVGDGSIDDANVIVNTAVSGTGAPVAASEQDYTFYVKQVTLGYQVADEPIDITWKDYSACTAHDDATAAHIKDMDAASNKSYYIVAETTGNEAWDKAGVKKVTIKKELFAKVIEKSYINNGEEPKEFHDNGCKLTVTANDAVKKVIYLSFDLPTGYSSALNPKDAKLKYEYGTAANKDVLLTGAITGLDDPDEATYKITQAGEGVDKDAAGILDKDEYAVQVVADATELAAAGIDGSTVAKMAAYEIDNNTLYIANVLLDNVISTERTVKIAVDTTKAESPKYTSVTADTESAKYVTFNLTGAQDRKISQTVPVVAAPKSVDVAASGDKDTILDDTPVRVIKKVKFSADGGTTFVDDAKVTASAPNYTLAADVFDEAKALTVYAECEDAIVVKSDKGTLNTDYAVYGKSGNEAGAQYIAKKADVAAAAACQPVTGKPYTFKVVSKKAKNSITKVEYYFGTEKKGEATQNADGSWSATTPAVSNTLTISVTLNDNNTAKKVKLASAYTSIATLADVITGTNLDASGTQEFVTYGKPYSFTLTPATGKYISKITYKDGVKDAVDLTPADAVSVDDNGVMTFTTKEAINDDLVITLEDVAGYKLKAPENKNVRVSFAEPGKSIYVDGREEFPFSVQLASGVSGVTFKSIGTTSEPAKYGTQVGSYKIAAGSTPIDLKAVTEQAVPRSQFQVEWVATAGDSDPDHLKLTKWPETPTSTTGTTDNEQALTLAGTENVTIKATFKQNDIGIASDTDITTGTLKDTTEANAIASLSGSLVVTADNYKTGSNSIVVKNEVADKELATGAPGMAGNKLVFTAELPLTVVKQFSGFRAVAANNSTYATDAVIEGAKTSDTVYFHVLGTNGRTGTESLVTTSASTISKISWTTNPNVKGDGDPAFVVAGGYDVNYLTTSTFKSSVTSVSATPVITYADSASTTATATAAAVKISAPATYGIFPTVAVDDGETKTYVADGGTFTIAAKGSMNKLTVDYKVYKEVKTGAFAAIGNATQLAKAIEDGDIVAAELDAAPTFTLTNEDASTNVYATGEPSGARYTLTGAKATPVAVGSTPAKPVDIKMSAVINKIKLDDFTIIVTVKNEIDPVDVTLNIVNPGAKTDSKVNRQVLSNDPTFVGDASKVILEVSDTDGASAGTGTTKGIKYSNVSKGSTFTLPGLSDFDNTKFGKSAETVANPTGVAYVPYGWVYDLGGTGQKYYELGATNVPVGDGTASFDLLWNEKYDMADAWNENDKNATTGKYQNPLTAAFGVAIDGEIPVTLETKELVGVFTKDETIDGVDYYTGNPKYTTTYVKSGFTLTETTTDKLLDQTKLASLKISGKYTGNATATVEWADPDTNKHITSLGAITVENKKNLTLEVDSSTTLNDNDELELTVGKADKNLNVLLKNNGTGAPVANYTFTVTIGSTVVEKGTLSALSTNVESIPLSAKSAGNTTVTVNVSDTQGNTAATPLVVNVKVADSAVRFAMTETVNDQKVAIDAVELSVDETVVDTIDFANYKQKTINIQAFAKSGSSTTPLTEGTWTVAGDATVAAANPVKTDDSQGGINVTVGKANTDATTFGTGYVTVTYKAKGDTTPYTFKIPVKTYKPVVLKKAANIAVVDKNGNRVTDGATPTPALLSTFIKVFRDESEEAKADSTKETYNVDLQGYTAEYTNGTAKTFDGWQVTGIAPSDGVYATSTIDLKTASTFLGGSATDYGFNFKANGTNNNDDITKAVLDPYFTDVPIKNIEFKNVEGNKITLTDEETASTDITKNTAMKVVQIRVTDPGTLDTINVISSKVGFFGIIDEKGKIGTDGKTYSGTFNYDGPIAAAAGTTAISLGTVDTDKNTRLDEFTIGAVKGQAGSTTLTFKSNTNEAVLGTLTLNVNGAVYTAGAVTGYVEDGEEVKSDVRKVKGESIYFDEDGKALTASGVTYVKSLDKHVLVNRISGVKHVPYGKGVQTVAGKQYYVKDDETGEVAFKELIEVAGVKRYANSEGVLVTHDMATDGKYTDPETKVTYLIDKDTNAAEEDDKKLVSKVEYTWNPSKNSDYKHDTTPTVTIKVSYKYDKKQTEDSDTLENLTATLVSSTTTEKVYSAPVPEGAYYDPTTKEAYDFTKDKDYKKTYKIDAGGDGKKDEQGGTTPTEPSQPENKTAWNLFYKGFSMDLDLPSEANLEKVASNAKWAQFYKIDGSTVTLKNDENLSAADAKKAANSSNSLIVIPMFDSDGNEIGDYEYSLPVFYQKPNLKLTSTKGTFSTASDAPKEQTFSTVVTEKKSTGAYDPVELSDGDFDWVISGSNPKPTLATGSKTGEITITATAKTSGKIKVQPESWREAITPSYTVAKAAKNVITASATTVTFNVKDTDASTAKEVDVFLNGVDSFNDGDITATYPNNWSTSNIEINGIDESSKAVSSKLTLSVKSGAAPAKGNYTIKLKTKDNATFNFKVAVSNLDTTNKAVTLKVQAKMDLTTGQKMVVIPTLKGVSGTIDSVEFDDASKALFDVSYDDQLNQIVVSPVDGATVSSQNYDTKLKITVGGVECTTQLKFKPNATKPTIKIDKIKLPKNQIKTPESDGSKIAKAAGQANILSTYKYNGKMFTIKPEKVEFYEGNNKLTPDNDESDWYYAPKANLLVQYDETNDKILVRSLVNANGKAGNVKVVATYHGGVTKNATLSVGTVNR